MVKVCFIKYNTRFYLKIYTITTWNWVVCQNRSNNRFSYYYYKINLLYWLQNFFKLIVFSIIEQKKKVLNQKYFLFSNTSFDCHIFFFELCFWLDLINFPSKTISINKNQNKLRLVVTKKIVNKRIDR